MRFTLRRGSVCGALLMAAALTVPAQSVQMYITSPDLSRTLELQPRLVFAAETRDTPTIAIKINEKIRYQVMDGFGGAMTDGAAWLIEERLKPSARDEVLTRLFDPKQGIGLSFLRQPIGSTDLSRSHSSFDDVGPGQKDIGLRHFSIEHDEKDVLPALRSALKLNPEIKIMLTPWSPPAWMKSGDSMDGGQLRDDAMPAYAAYLTKAVQAYEGAAIPVEFLSVQNEPLNETRDYPGTLMLAAQAARFIGEYLGPDLQSAHLDTKVLAYDHNWDHIEYPLTILSDPRAAPFVAGSALHCYGGDVSAQSLLREKSPDKGIWMTECSGGTWDKDTALAKTAHVLIESTRNWAKAVVLWGLVLDSDHGPHDGGCGTCRPLVEVDLNHGEPAVSYTGDFYGLGHASKFVHRGAVRIDSNSFGVRGLETVAFENTDGSIALLVLNNGISKETFQIEYHGQQVTTRLAAGELATFVWQVPVRGGSVLP